MNKTVKLVAETYTQEQIILKVLEECAELSEVLLKFLTKKPELKPPTSKITKEAGDVIFRIAVMAEKMKLTDEINDRVNEKEQIMFEYVISKQL